MKKILLATTMLAGTAGFAAAEVTFGGSAYMGLIYDGGAPAGADSITIDNEVTLTVTMSGTTDGGLEFGASLPILADNESSLANDGSTVYIKGAFGQLTFGSVAEADEVAALSDVGYEGLGVDNVAEARSGDSNGGLAHNVHYSNTFGGLSVAVSAAVGKQLVAAVPNDSYALGLKYSFGDAYVGLGYNDTNIAVAAAARDGEALSLYAGGTFGSIGAKAMYTKFSSEIAANDGDSYGIQLDYTSGPLGLTLVAADSDFAAGAAVGVGMTYDLGGGAKVQAGIANVDDGVAATDDLGAEFGIAMSF